MAKTKGFNIKIDGLREAKIFLNNKNKKTGNIVNKAIHDVGFYVVGKVKDSIAGRSVERRSVDTGRFLNSISPDNKLRFISKIEPHVSYADYLEFGTSKGVSPRLHFTNTAKRERDKVTRFVASKLK